MRIFAKDAMWELTHWRNESQGIASERTETWDSTTTFSGWVMIAVGVFVSSISF